MVCVIGSTGKGVVVNCSTPTRKPCKQTSPCICRDFELNRTFRLMRAPVKEEADRPNMTLFQRFFDTNLAATIGR